MNFKKSLLAFVFMLSPLMINGGTLHKDLTFEEELAVVNAIEQAILNMSPEEQAALNAEIDNAINSLPEDQRAQLLEEMSRYEQELIRLYPK